MLSNETVLSLFPCQSFNSTQARPVGSRIPVLPSSRLSLPAVLAENQRQVSSLHFPLRRANATPSSVARPAKAVDRHAFEPAGVSQLHPASFELPGLASEAEAPARELDRPPVSAIGSPFDPPVMPLPSVVELVPLVALLPPVVELVPAVALLPPVVEFVPPVALLPPVVELDPPVALLPPVVELDPPVALLPPVVELDPLVPLVPLPPPVVAFVPPDPPAPSAASFPSAITSKGTSSAGSDRLFRISSAAPTAAR